MSDLDEQVRTLLGVGATTAAATLVLRELGPEILGFLSGVLAYSDADEVFAAWSERLWRSLGGFEGRCTIRTWAYVLARRELVRFRRGTRRHAEGRVPISELADVLAVVRSRSRSTMLPDRQRKLAALRDALPIDDRTLLILRVDRNLSWYDVALAFAETPEDLSEQDRKREAARLRKRFQLIKQRLLARARAELVT